MQGQQQIGNQRQQVLKLNQDAVSEVNQLSSVGKYCKKFV